MKTYKIGDCTVLFDEIVSIEPAQLNGSNYVDVPISLKYGGRIRARIRAKNDEIVDWGSPYSAKFLERFKKEINNFSSEWVNYIENLSCQ